MPDKNDPRWFTLAMASRWPLAVVIAAGSVAVAATQILRQPIPIGLPSDSRFQCVSLAASLLMKSRNL